MTSLLQVEEQASTCVRCRLAETRTQVVFGTGPSLVDLLVLGEAPGRNEDLGGEPFIGRSGQLLDRLIDEELSMSRAEFYIANVVKCRPPENRNPKPDEIASCAPWLEQQLELLNPKVILTLGNFATRAMLHTKEGITNLRGRAHQYEGRWLVPTFHPSAALRSGGKTIPAMREDLQRVKAILGGDVPMVSEVVR